HTRFSRDWSSDVCSSDLAFFALSQGAVIWVFISEIFPNEVRGMGQSLGSFTHWILAAVIANVFPYFANRFGGDTVFLFFMVMMRSEERRVGKGGRYRGGE